MDHIKRFDMDKKPKKELFLLTPLAYLLSFPTIWKQKLKVHKYQMDGLKPPYILLCTHHAFIDFKVTTAAIFPYRANYIVAIDGFIKREWLLRHVGAICKRKFTNDLKLFRHIKYGLDELNQVMAIYPEARYSLCGTHSILPESLGKMVKVLNYPVVVLNMHGNYLSQPVWNLKKRHVPLNADMTQILTREDIKNLETKDIQQRIEKAFVYDEYTYQKTNQIKIDSKTRMEGMHKVLYHCPNCLTEHQMTTKGHQITCDACKKTWSQDVYGSLKAEQGKIEFSHIPDWFSWQKEQVRKEIENKTYYFEDDVLIESLPNAKGYINLGKGKLIHDAFGFMLKAYDTNLELIKPPLSMYGLHIEYNYFNKGDCIDLSTLEDTYYLYPKTTQNVVTKLHFATEIFYEIEKEKLKNEKLKRV